MKRVVSVSLGSAKRDHAVETDILGEKFRIERQGTDGDMNKAIAIIRELDGQVDAFGLGGTDLYLWAGKKRYVLRSSLPIVRAASRTPIVDGSGLKNTLERKVIRHLHQKAGMDFQDRNILIVSAMDRFGMAEAFVETGARMTYGDLIFALGIPMPLHSLAAVHRLAAILMPFVSRMPLEWIYPTGSKQEAISSKHARYLEAADVVGGDFHFIRRHLPARLDGKTIVTNTVTAEDVELLRARGLDTLVTTTPELNGRSFGTNVMEGVLIALAGKPPGEVTARDYEELLDRVGFVPRIERLAR